MISDVTLNKDVQPEPAAEPPTRLFNRNYVLLLQGQTVSRLGNQVFAVALWFWIKDVTESATILGLIVALTALPGLLLEPIGGAMADRYSRRRIIVISDLIGGLVVLALAAAVYFAPAHPATLVWLFVASMLLATINAFFIPAIAASVPDLVPDDRLGSANSLGQLSMQLSLFIGQGLGGVLVRVLGIPLLFLFNGLSFLFAAASARFITIPQRTVQRAESWRELFVAFKNDIIDGLRYVRRATGLWEFLLLSTAVNFFGTPIIVLLPFFVEDTLGVAVDWYGYIAAAFGIGSLVGYLVMLVARISGRTRALLMLLCFVVGGAGDIALGLVTAPLVVVALAFLGGCTSGFVAVNITTILQRTTPSEMRGRVFGLLGTLAGAVAPVAAALAGVATDLLNKNVPLIYSTCGVIIIALTLLMALNRNCRYFLAYEAPRT